MAETTPPDFAFLIDQFHRTLEGIRELREVAAPHLSKSEASPRPVLEVVREMTKEQRSAVCLVLAHRVGLRRRSEDTPEISDGYSTDASDAAEPSEETDAPAEDRESEASFRMTLRSLGQPTVHLEVIEELREPVERAMVGSLPEEDFNAILQRVFAGNLALLAEFFSSFGSPETLDPDKEDLLNSSMLITAVATFETLVVGILSAQIHVFPGLLDGEEKQFSLADLQDFGSVDDAREAAIDQRVDRLMREGISAWARWFNKRASFELDALALDADAFAEVFQRRNIVVHNGGQVSRQYLANVPKSDVELGQQLSIDSDYLERALDELDVLGVALGVSAWATWVPEDVGDAVQELHRIAYELLASDRFIACEKLCHVGRDLGGDGWVREAMRVNAWIARKNVSGLDSIKSDVETWDTSALAAEFALAKVTLLEQYDHAFDLIPRLLETEAISMQALDNWPLFSGLREHPRYESVRMSESRRDPSASAEQDPEGGERDVDVEQSERGEP